MQSSRGQGHWRTKLLVQNIFLPMWARKYDDSLQLLSAKKWGKRKMLCDLMNCKQKAVWPYGNVELPLLMPQHANDELGEIKRKPPMLNKPQWLYLPMIPRALLIYQSKKPYQKKKTLTFLSNIVFLENILKWMGLLKIPYNCLFTQKRVTV